MRYWFSRITDREQALWLIRISSTLFYLLAAMQIGVVVLIAFVSANVRGYASLPPDAVFDYLATAVAVVILASLLRSLHSRIAAVTLLTLSIVIAAITFVGSAANSPSGSRFMALMAIWIATRATQATFKLHGRFAKEPPTTDQPTEEPKPQPIPTADFISHPRSGLESAAATDAAMRRRPPKYDREKWAALLKYDDELAIVAGRISPLGQKWLDEFAHAYLTLNDKKYLQKIEEKIFADARAETARSRL